MVWGCTHMHENITYIIISETLDCKTISSAIDIYSAKSGERNEQEVHVPISVN